jgi:hypothetical protein
MAAIITSEINLHESELREKLLPRLLGRVFHATLASSWDSIQASGAILLNDGKLTSPFGSGASANSFFRHRGCVSVFDYRSMSPEQLEDSIRKCSVFQTHMLGPELAILFLAPFDYGVLIPWTKWKEEQARNVIVPYVEAGYPGNIPITSIEEVLLVKVEIQERPIAHAIMENRRRRIAEKK